jgi:transcriptional regulator with XRE-family HTH domain
MNRRIKIKQWFLAAEAQGRKVTQRQIAKEANVSHQLVCMILAGTRKNEAVKAALARHGFPVDLLDAKDDDSHEITWQESPQ